MVETRDKYNYLSVKDLQKKLGMGHNAAYALMSLKGFPSFKIGRKYFVEENDLHEYFMLHKGSGINLTS